MAKNEEFISLRQAAELSGYSADYVGQLIRQGKLPGKQVYSHVAWMTTEGAIRDYISQKGKTPTMKNGAFANLKEAYLSHEKLTALIKPLLWGAIVIFSTVTLCLFFVLAIGIDHRLEQQSLQSAEYGG